MTIDVRDLRVRLRESADYAASQAVTARELGRALDAEFHSGRQAAFLTALNLVGEVEDAAAAERDANIQDEAIGEEAARLGLIGDDRGVIASCPRCGSHLTRRATAFWQCLTCDHEWQETGASVDIGAVERLEEFARRTEVAIGGGNPHTLDGYGAYVTETGALDQASGTVYSDADGGL